jgi:thiosulfate dehydrogenase
MQPSARLLTVAAVIALSLTSGGLRADEDEEKYEHSEAAQDFVYGAPAEPSLAWRLAAGGRIYDNWWEALDREEPVGTHPSYPAGGEQTGEVTWRCKECHGWDYRGRDGIYRSGSHFTGIPGIDGAIGRPVDEIAAMLRGDIHRYTPEMLTDNELANVALFVSEGQVDMASFIDLETRALIPGDVERGRAVFQTVCAACHGFDGKLLNWGEGDENNFVGTEAANLPDEVMHKILNAHPGAAMVNLRALTVQDAIDVLSYAATLPTE